MVQMCMGEKNAEDDSEEIEKMKEQVLGIQVDQGLGLRQIYFKMFIRH